uniref:rhomboid family intramembrane serine protease n=1 Tax=Fulvivirga sp. TaxID=1931237 RepID=UPI00404AAF12
MLINKEDNSILIEEAKSAPIATIFLILINCSIFIYQLVIYDSMGEPLIALKWGANFAAYTLNNEPWRLITSMFLHFGWIHLIANMYSLYVLGTALERRLGTVVFIGLYLLSGISGSIFSIYWNLFVMSAGASGAIFGLYGFDFILLLVINKKEPRLIRNIIINFIVYVAIIGLLGPKFHFDNAAHLGGLICGVLIAALYSFLKSEKVYFHASLVGILGLLIVAFSQLPPYQKQYFNIYQYFIKVDDNFNQAMLAENDEELIESFEIIRPQWDTLAQKLDSLNTNLPAELASDKNTLILYSRYKSKEMDFMLEGISRESYIFHDSVGLMRDSAAMLSPLNFPLRLSYASFRDDSNDTISNQPPGNMIRVFYDSLWVPTDQWKAEFYRIGFKDSLDRWTGFVHDYYMDGKIQMKGSYKAGLKDGVFIYYSKNNTYEAAGRYVNETHTGKWEYFHENGELQSEMRYQARAYLINSWDQNGKITVSEGNGYVAEYHSNGVIKSYTVYRDGIRDSTSFGYYKNGQLKFREKYENGLLVYGEANEPDGGKVTYDISTYIPYPVGGMEKFKAYVKEAKKLYSLVKKQSGEIELIFNVVSDGRITDIKILSSNNPSLNKIAKSILEFGPEWVPARDHGLNTITTEGYVKINL